MEDEDDDDDGSNFLDFPFYDKPTLNGLIHAAILMIVSFMVGWLFSQFVSTYGSNF